jgi:hypothetical protein
LERVVQAVSEPAKDSRGASGAVGYAGVALSDEDAARLAAAARDRRRADRLREAKEGATEVKVDAKLDVKEDGGAGSLLAAKKRARERFEDEAG